MLSLPGVSEEMRGAIRHASQTRARLLLSGKADDMYGRLSGNRGDDDDDLMVPVEEEDEQLQHQEELIKQFSAEYTTGE